MTNPLTERRTELAAAYASALDLPAHPYEPYRLTPPLVMVAPHDPYVTAEDFTTRRYRYRARVVAVPSTDPTEVGAWLDEQISKALEAGLAEAVSEPFQLVMESGARFPAVDLIITTT